MTPAELTATIESALMTVLEVEDFELTESFDGKGVDVSGDDWTWHVEDDLSYLAIDDEPDESNRYAAAIEKNLTGPVIAALQEIEVPTRVVLCNLLTASGDPVSLAFVELLRG